MPDTTQDAQSDAERARRALVEWSIDDSLMSPVNLSRWYKGSTYRRLPDKSNSAPWAWTLWATAGCLLNH
jgi:hypothetical protein